MRRQIVISHLYKENNCWIIQTNGEHQKGVAEMTAYFTGQFGLPSWGYALGMLHDKGTRCFSTIYS